MAVKRTTFQKKATAKKHRGAGRRVYKVDEGYRVSPECPRSAAKRRELIKGRTKTKRGAKAKAKAKRPARRKKAIEIVWTDRVPF